MDNIINQVQSLIKNCSDDSRKMLITDLRDLSISLEDSDDTLQRISNTPLQLYGAWIGSTLKIFEILSREDKPVSIEALALETKADQVLLGRLLRYMSSVKLIEEPGHNLFTSNNVTKTLATPRGQNSLDVYYNIANPALYELPRFLQQTDFQNPSDETRTAFTNAYNFPGPMYAWLGANPEKANVFNKHMEFRREDGGNCFDTFPFEKYIEPQRIDEIVFVDIGGGMGHQCHRLREQYPKLEGRVILQDLPHAIDNALNVSGVEKMVHDIFQPQPIKGARMYYLRGVLHCFNDEKSANILQNTVMAMGQESVILIDDAVFPNHNVFWQATQMDILMMSSLASMERTRSQWEKLLHSAGLKIVDIYPYAPKLYESVILAVKA